MDCLINKRTTCIVWLCDRVGPRRRRKWK